MADVASSPTAKTAKSGSRRLLPVALMLVMLGAGFASSFFGMWSPLGLLAGHEPEHPEAPVSAVDFVTLPQVVLSLAGPDFRTLVMTIQLETDAAHRAEVEHLVPRLMDAFNTFLAGIDPVAFEKRGVLDIVRDELATRAVYVLGKEAFSDILITEFRIQ